ncbi:MAG: hypothetical protein R2795_08935 [Saprospiraceae bacterium]
MGWECSGKPETSSYYFLRREVDTYVHGVAIAISFRSRIAAAHFHYLLNSLSSVARMTKLNSTSSAVAAIP